MLKIENTENLTGVCISGDYEDLYNLVEAFHEITVNEYDDAYDERYAKISSRVLGLCYDVRHAYQGDRQVEFVENGMDKHKMIYHEIVVPKSNVYYKVNYLYPEMIYILIALNELVRFRMKNLAKTNMYDIAFSKNVIWDETIATIRFFQSMFVKCVKETLSEAAFSRFLNMTTKAYTNIYIMAHQYLDLLNIRYINMDKEKRLKNLSIFTKRIVEFMTNVEHNEIKTEVENAAKEHNCHSDDIRMVGCDYPEVTDW